VLRSHGRPPEGVESVRRDAWFRAVRPEWIVLCAILALGAYLRLHALDLVEFKGDEATAFAKAGRLLDGVWPTVGLTSSVGALNPPFFIYLIAIPLAVHNDPLAATAFIGVLAVIAIGLTYVVLRPRFGSLTALTAAAFFAAAPWAVLYGRKIWAQDALPIVDVALLWCLLLVLERRRTRAVLGVPVFFCLAFQLNFSALALIVPAVVVVAYRARDVDWRLLAAGVGAAALLLGPWLGHEAAHGFVDVGRLLSEGRGSRGSTPIGAGTAKAIHESVNVLGAWNWSYVVGPSRAAVAGYAGWAWTWGTWATGVATALLALGFVTCAVRIVLGASLRRGWPWVELDVDARRRALLLVWLVGIWLSYVTSGTDQIYPHYLIVTYPVSFAVAALGAADVVRLVRRRLRPAGAAVVVAAAAVVGGYVAFMVAFLDYVDREGGVKGDYGIVYRDEAALGRVMKQRGLQVANVPQLQVLATGSVDEPPAGARLVGLRNTLLEPRSFTCAGERRSFGPLAACLPRRG
jgi:4-amino-4-deoxy-L-arabinose transferase-like glycosyltransferase